MDFNQLGDRDHYRALLVSEIQKTFTRYHQTITQETQKKYDMFIKSKSDKVYRNIFEADLPILAEDKSKILNKFIRGNADGDIYNGKNCEEEVALILAAYDRAEKKRQIFFINAASDGKFIDCVAKLMFESTQNNIHQFQVVFNESDSSHYVFAEIVIDKRQAKPDLKIFFCDPALTYTSYDQLIHSYFLNQWQNDANVEVYLPYQELLQKGAGCTYFSIDGCLKLSNQDKYENSYTYMKKNNVHQNSTDFYNFTLFSSKLPVRLKQTSQVVVDQSQLLFLGLGMRTRTESYDLKGLQSSVIDNPEEANKIVNKKGETAAQAVGKHIQEKEGNKLNTRIDYLEKKYKEKVSHLLDVITHGELQKLIDKHTIKGLEAYCVNQIESSPSFKPL